MEDLKGGQWVHCTKKTQGQRNDLQRNVSLTVTAVEVASVDVKWKYGKETSFIAGKQEKLTGDAIKEIRVLDRYKSLCLELGDVRCLTVGDEGIPPVVTLEEWKKATMQELKEGTGREERRNIALKGRGVLKEAAWWSFIRAEEESKVKQSTTKAGNKKTTPAKGLKVGSVGGGKSGKGRGKWGKKGKGAGVNLAQTGGDARGIFQGQEGSSSVGSDGASEPPALSLKPGQKITVEALRVATYIDVLWQDGTESIAVPSCDLYPDDTFDEHEFFPGTHVLMETSNSDAVNAPQKGMDGIVQWASQADRTAMVRWLPADRPGDAEEDDELSQLIEKEHAVYELKRDLYLHYRIGDIVLLLRGGGIIPKCYVLDVRSEMKKLEEQFSPSVSKSCQKGDSDEVDSTRVVISTLSALVEQLKTFRRETVSLNGVENVKKVGSEKISLKRRIEELSSRIVKEHAELESKIESERQNLKRRFQELSSRIQKESEELEALRSSPGNPLFWESADRVVAKLKRFKDFEYIVNATVVDEEEEFNFVGEVSDIRTDGLMEVTFMNGSCHCVDIFSLVKVTLHDGLWSLDECPSSQDDDSNSSVTTSEGDGDRKDEDDEWETESEHSWMGDAPPSTPVQETPQATKPAQAARGSVDQNSKSSSSPAIQDFQKSIERLQKLLMLPDGSTRQEDVPDAELTSSLEKFMRALQSIEKKCLHRDGDSCIVPYIWHTMLEYFKSDPSKTSWKQWLAFDQENDFPLKNDEGGSETQVENVNVLVLDSWADLTNHLFNMVYEVKEFKRLKESSSEHIEDLEESVEQDQSVEYLNEEESVEEFKDALDTLPSESLEEDVESREQEKPQGAFKDALNHDFKHEKSEEIGEDRIVMEFSVAKGAKLAICYDVSGNVVDVQRKFRVEFKNLNRVPRIQVNSAFSRITNASSATIFEFNTERPLNFDNIAADIVANHKFDSFRHRELHPEEKEGKSGTFILSDDDPPVEHRFFSNKYQTMDRGWMKKVVAEHKLLAVSLPSGITVIAYSNRMDLLTAMIQGPAGTPYEGALFFFDIQLPSDYPSSPPAFKYLSYCTERLNPNLYEDGKVCISLLGTWSGQGSELWGPGSTLLQVLLSIQGLILNKDPYYNEAGYEKHRGSADAAEAARTYNEMALIKTVQSMRRILESPPRDFRDRVESYFKGCANVMLPRLEKFASNETPTKEFPIAPTSRGFRLAFAKAVQQFKDTLSEKGYLDISSEAASTAAPSSSQD
ncbi:unnamed protein product [Cyprideis torosa]|uniref:Uncharacterized protein n=1 Tax=Cyprideis torosa TaxID=163714 RepID=A0A7R8ZL65_9CRUS|nr:unnamed protein product [Cyprideis torosa]CAG0891086.1 unnamed protein product [Cyprideis torosa]